MSGSSNKLTFFEQVMEWIGWLQIAASPFVIGLGVGTVCYFKFPGRWGFTLGVGFVVMGTVIGAWWATRVKRRGSTVTFLSHSIDSSSEDPARGDETER